MPTWKNSPFAAGWLALAAALCLPLSAHAALEAVKVWPMAGEVPADAPLRIVFNQPPVVGSRGRIDQGSQAEAFHLHGDRCTLRHADFYSFQDTLHLDGHTDAEDCTIEGNVDFFWGAGSAFFEKCELHAVHISL